MSKHDTLVRLVEGNPFEPILHVFDNGLIPMRDPFSLKTAKDAEGNNVALWVVDMERLTTEQAYLLSELIAVEHGVAIEEIQAMAAREGGFLINNDNVAAAFGGAECYARTLELAEFLESHSEPNKEKFEEFRQQQYRDWIDGNKTPDPMPENYEDVDERIKSPELEQAYKERAIEKFLEQGNYSVFDVLTGGAMIDALNFIDPDNQWELVNDCIDDLEE